MIQAQMENTKKQAVASEEVKAMKEMSEAGMKKVETDAETRAKKAEAEKKEVAEKAEK